MGDDFNSGSGTTALFFSITIGASFFLAMFTGRWVDRVGPRPVLLSAAVSMVAGLLATAAAPNLWIGYLTYGLGVGFSIACGYVPMVATVSGWFAQRRAAALGVAVAGIGAGTLVGNPLAAWLIERSSWRTAYIYFAFGSGCLLLIAAGLAERGPAATASSAPVSLRRSLQNPAFAWLYVAIAAISFSLFVPFVFITDYATDEGVDAVPAALLVGLIGGTSVLGRLVLGGLADKLDPYILFVGSFATMTISHLVWFTSEGRYWQLVVYAVVLGVGYGGFIALSPAVAADLFGLDGLGAMLGTLYTSAGVGALFGPPIAGAILDASGYGEAILFAFVMSSGASVALLFVRRSPA